MKNIASSVRRMSCENTIFLGKLEVYKKKFALAHPKWEIWKKKFFWFFPRFSAIFSRKYFQVTHALWWFLMFVKHDEEETMKTALNNILNIYPWSDVGLGNLNVSMSQQVAPASEDSANKQIVRIPLRKTARRRKLNRQIIYDLFILFNSACRCKIPNLL